MVVSNINSWVPEQVEVLVDCYLALQELEKVESGKSRVWMHAEIEQNCDSLGGLKDL